jgi:hypothetical protein
MILHDRERIGIQYWNVIRHTIVLAQEKDREKQDSIQFYMGLISQNSLCSKLLKMGSYPFMIE